MMKIAFCNRKNWNNPLGGDGVQMLKTKEKLEELYNLDIHIINDPDDLDSSFDVIHIFNYATFMETNAFFIKAKSLKIKIVSSSIFWDYKYAITPIINRLGIYPNFIGAHFEKLSFRVNNVISYIFHKPILLSPKFKKYLRNFILDSDLILPNSKEEGELLLEFSNLDNDKLASVKNKIKVVYNGVDMSNYKIMPKSTFNLKYKIPENFILQVSRVQFLKNQLNLLYSLMNNKNIPIVFVGKIIEQNYFKKLQKLAKKRGNVFFIPEIDHRDIYSFYYYAATHVLLSLRESPGLVSLEALSQGCPIVVSDKRFAPVETYFNDHVEIVNPLDCDSIREGVLRSYSKQKIEVDISKFSWDNVATQTYNNYLLLF